MPARRLSSDRRKKKEEEWEDEKVEGRKEDGRKRSGEAGKNDLSAARREEYIEVKEEKQGRAPDDERGKRRTKNMSAPEREGPKGGLDPLIGIHLGRERWKAKKKDWQQRK